MARYSSRGKSRARRGSYRTASRRTARPRVARRSSRGSARSGQTVRLVIQHAAAPNGYMPGVPGTVGIANVPPSNPKAKF